ncbi:MAG: DUF190 domain-containing protein [Candidatus Solibacter sp.]|nr:DUF190 domain-containing protein [Candidatus Solibacter sp.]
MSQEQSAKLLRIHISEADRHQGRPLYEALVEKCRELKISGATVFRGLEGYGETAGMHKPHLMRHDQPIVIAIVDSAENIARLMQAAGEMVDTGVMAVSEVRARRVQKKAADQGGIDG